MGFSKVFQKLIKTTNLVKQEAPDLEFKNPLKNGDVFVNIIELVPFGDFGKNGRIEIFINDVLLFTNAKTDDSIEGLDKKTIPLEKKKLKNGESGTIKFFIWNSVNDNEIRVTIAVKISDSPLADTVGIISASVAGEDFIIRGSEYDSVGSAGGGTASDNFPNNTDNWSTYTVPDNTKAECFGTFRVDSYGTDNVYIEILVRNELFQKFSLFRAIKLGEGLGTFNFKLLMKAGWNMDIDGSLNAVADGEASILMFIKESPE